MMKKASCLLILLAWTTWSVAGQPAPESTTSPQSVAESTSYYDVVLTRRKNNYYGLNDFGHPGPPQYKRQPVRKGVYKGQLDWDGKNWNGPSDFDAPKGDAFPPGDYQLRLTLHGMVDTGRGRQPFSIERVVPVTVTE